MWGDIILAIGEAVIGAIGTRWIEKRKRDEFSKGIKNVLSKRLSKYADTSLDCDEFYSFVNSRRFKNLIKNYFCSTADRMSNNEYEENIEGYIHEECPGVHHLDARNFLREIKELYKDYLESRIEQTPELNTIFQLIVLSQRDMISKIVEDGNSTRRYLKSLSIEDSKINSVAVSKYHSVCERKFGKINFVGIVGAEGKYELDIREYYVKNTFSFYRKREPSSLENEWLDNAEPIMLKDFFEGANKIVLVGGAGYGKTTTLNFIFCEYEKLFNCFALKIKIDLNEYAKDICENKGLLSCIMRELNNRFDKSIVSDQDIKEVLLKHLEEGKCLIILDALDEVPTQEMRVKVKDEIGCFTEIYYLNRFIISTREVGYLKNRFDESFLHIKINNFDDGQIEQYCKKWYSLCKCGNPDVFFEGFVSEAQRARCWEIIRNPIMLVLALIIFKIEANLPNTRVEFYKKCIDTFLEDREGRKRARLLSEKMKNILRDESVIPKIAFYLFKKNTEVAGFRMTYDGLRNAIFYATEIAEDQRIYWNEAIRQYSEYLIERSELIRETDEDTLGFAHKTFYEYFLAVYFSKKVNNEVVLKYLDLWLGDSNYDELARLVIEVIIHNDDSDKTQMVIGHLLSKLDEDKGKTSANRFLVMGVIGDLYAHNMLPPRFHPNYNKAIILNSRIVYRYNQFRTRSIRNRRITIDYDSKMLAGTFFEMYAARGNLIGILDSLYYLDNKFKTQIRTTSSDELLIHIINLFSGIKEKKRNKVAEMWEEERLFFIGEGIKYVLGYPLIYLSVVYAMIITDDYWGIENMIYVNFMGERCSDDFIRPIFLRQILRAAKTDRIKFLVILIVLIECSSKEGAVRTIRQWLDLGMFGGINARPHMVEEEAIWLWDILNKPDQFEDFKYILTNEGLYDGQYDDIYKKVFKDCPSHLLGNNRLREAIEMLKIRRDDMVEAVKNL